MNVYLVAATNVDRLHVSQHFPEIYEVQDHVWAIGSELATSADVCRVLGMDAENQTWGVVVKVDSYFGYQNTALWQKIEAWKAQA